MVKKIRLLLFCILSSSILIAAAQTDPELSIQAKVKHASVPLNYMVQLTIDIVYKDPNLKIDLKLPDLDPNFIIKTRSQSKSLTNSNGDIEIKHRFTYHLAPQKEGNVSIPAIRAITKTETFETDTIFLTITAAVDTPQEPNATPLLASTQAPRNTDIKLEAQISTTNIYLGQTISYKLVLLRKRSYWNTINVAFPNFENAWVKELETQKEEYIVEEDNNRYYAYELLHKDIAPLESGDYLIPTASISFSSGPFSPVQEFRSHATTINVISLPENAPTDFNGAVGDFQLRANLEKEALLSNSPNTLRLTISGKGNLDQITDLVYPKVDHLNIYRSSAKTLPNAQTQADERIIEYIIVPEKPGLIRIPDMSLSYFSPTTKDYQTLQTTDLQFKALGSTNETAQDTSTENTLNIDQDPQIKPFKIPRSIVLWQRPALIALFLFHGIIIALNGFKWLRNKANPTYRHTKTIEKALHISLKKIQNSTTQAIQVQTIILQFIEHILQLPLKGSAYKQIQKKVISHGISKKSAEILIALLQQIDQHAFQNQDSPEQSLKHLKSAAITLLKTIKKELSS